MYAYSSRFLLPIAAIAVRTTTTITTTTITSLRINNEQRRFSSFHAFFFLLFYSFIVYVCVYRKQKDCRFVVRHNNKMMILATFGLLFCCNYTIFFFLFSFSFLFLSMLFRVSMSVGVLCTPFSFLYFMLSFSLGPV